MALSTALILLGILSVSTLCLVTARVAFADGEAGEKSITSLQAAKDANSFSFDTGGVGIVMSYGTGNGVSAEEIGDQFVAEIENRGFKARYFYYSTDTLGMAMSFIVRYSTLGPWNIDDAAQNMGNIIRRAEAAKKVMGR